MVNMTSPQRPSAAVYRRRRLVVAIAALVVLALVIWGIVAGVRGIASAFSGHDDKNASQGEKKQKAAGGGSSQKAQSPKPAGANPDGTCPAGAVTITGSTDHPSYGAGQKPVLVMTLKNSLDDPCTLDVGTGAQEFLITSGSDRIFSTKDCQAQGAKTELELEPGKEETARFTWGRDRSQPKCAPTNATPRAGTYTLKVSLGKLEAKPVQFNLN